jgi:uncharacterized protein
VSWATEPLEEKWVPRLRVGEVAALFRYPVKSMRGESLDISDLGWHGLDGDRRLALRRLDDRGGFPWLTATRLPELLLFTPQRRTPAAVTDLPTHVRTPDGAELPVLGEQLASDIGRRCGSPVQMMYLDRGIFDEASVSVIASATVGEISRIADERPDVRRFRPNILIASAQSVPFEEDAWLGSALSFGETADPDTALPSPDVLKTIVRVRDNKAGVYASVARRGRLAVGQPVFLESATG